MSKDLKEKITEFYNKYAPYDEEQHDYSLYSLTCILADLRADNSNIEERVLLEQIIDEWHE